ncbi:MAG: cache domain-containing protein, partial [Alphaproteobacteria bacterium]
MGVEEDRVPLWGSRIARRVLVPFSVVLLLVVVAFVTVASLVQQAEHGQSLREAMIASRQMFSRNLERHAEILRSTLPSVAGDESLKRAFLSRDREELLRRATPAFSGLKAYQNITHFYFSGPDRTTFLRVHQPERHGDVIDRITTLEAERSGKSFVGLELGPLGNLTLRAVTPWRDGDQLIGYLEIGIEISHVLEEVHAQSGMDLLLTVDKRFLDRDRWEQGTRMLNRPGDWSLLRSSVLVKSTLDRLPEGLPALLENNGHEFTESLTILEDGGSYLVGGMPVIEAGGREVGSFLILRDVTTVSAIFQRTVLLIAVISVGAGGPGSCV